MGQRVQNRHIIGFSIICVATFALAPSSATLALVVGWTAICTAWMTVLGLQDFRSGERSIRIWLATIAVMMTVGTIVRGVHGSMTGSQLPFPSPADLIHFPAYCLFLAMLIHVHRKRATRPDPNAWLDGLGLSLGASVFAWIIFYSDFLQDERVSAFAKLVNAPFDVIMVIALATLLRISASPGRRPVAYYLLAIAGAAWVAIDLVAGYTIATGDGLSLTIALSPLAYGFGLAAVRDPSVVDILRPHHEGELRIGYSRLALLAFAFLSPLLLIVAPSDNFLDQVVLFSLVTALVLVVIARLLRLTLAQQYQSDLERRSSEEVARNALLHKENLLERLPLACERIAPRLRPFDLRPETSADSPRGWHILIGEDTQRITAERFPTPGEHRVIGAFLREVTQLADRATLRNLQESRKQEQEINRQVAINERRFRALVQNASDVVLVLDLKGQVTYISDSAVKVLGHETSAYMGRSLDWVVHENDWDFAQSYMQAFLTGTSSHLEHEVRAIHLDGSIRLLDLVLTDMRHVEGVDGIVVNISDVTEKRGLETNLRNAETIDPLTMQLNRTAFIREVDTALRRTSISSSSISLAIVNLDDFRLVNKGYGNALADEVLVEVAHRIRRSVLLDDVVARLNGDEFGILMADNHSTVEAEHAIERILKEITEPVTVAGRAISLGATAGLTANGDGSTTGIDMLRNADTALDAAKERRRGSIVVFEEAMGQKASERIELRNLLKDALKTNKLRLAYQPILDIETGQIRSLEALARWHDETRGNIGPATFIPIAESSGMITELGEWALRTACEQVAVWDKLGHDDFTVSVNMSGHQLREENVISRVKEIIEKSGVAPSRITIEITESVLIDDTDFVSDRICALRDLGLRLAIDDFGTGYSSLSYLERYQFDILKIDRSFVTDIHLVKNNRRAEIVRAIIAMAKGLGAITVGEGVEERVEGLELERLGCDLVQGFFYHRPMEVADVYELLLEENTAITSAA